jgi:uncharacterized membrane protein HdeD (DUF308 family)
MTEPRTGPAGDEGQPGGRGQPGSGPPADMSPGDISTGEMSSDDMSSGASGAGATSASSGEPDTGGVSTTTRSAAQPSVPQQYGRPSERSMLDEDQVATPGLGAGGSVIAATAGRSWPAVLAGGLLLIAVGVMLLVWPNVTLTIVAILIGAGLVVSGVVRLWEGFTSDSESGGMRAAYVVIGLLAILAGLYCLRHHALSLFLVAFVTGVYFIVHGVSDLGVALSAKVPGRALRGVLGVFSIAAGILMVVWPGITLVLLLTLVGAWLIFYGLVLGGLAFGLRKAAKQARAGMAGSAPASRELAASAR